MPVANKKNKKLSAKKPMAKSTKIKKNSKKLAPVKQVVARKKTVKAATKPATRQPKPVKRTLAKKAALKPTSKVVSRRAKKSPATAKNSRKVLAAPARLSKKIILKGPATKAKLTTKQAVTKSVKANSSKLSKPSKTKTKLVSSARAQGLITRKKKLQPSKNKIAALKLKKAAPIKKIKAQPVKNNVKRSVKAASQQRRVVKPTKQRTPIARTKLKQAVRKHAFNPAAAVIEIPLHPEPDHAFIVEEDNLTSADIIKPESTHNFAKSLAFEKDAEPTFTEIAALATAEAADLSDTFATAVTEEAVTSFDDEKIY